VGRVPPPLDLVWGGDCVPSPEKNDFLDPKIAYSGALLCIILRLPCVKSSTEENMGFF